jgi:hypothetical protein
LAPTNDVKITKATKAANIPFFIFTPLSYFIFDLVLYIPFVSFKVSLYPKLVWDVLCGTWRVRRYEG